MISRDDKVAEVRAAFATSMLVIGMAAKADAELILEAQLRVLRGNCDNMVAAELADLRALNAHLIKS